MAHNGCLFYSYEAAKVFSAANIPTTFICDAGIGASIERCNIVLVGAEGVMESGGIVNKVILNAL